MNALFDCLAHIPQSYPIKALIRNSYEIVAKGSNLLSPAAKGMQEFFQASQRLHQRKRPLYSSKRRRPSRTRQPKVIPLLLFR
jgi:hypothetical protein